MYKNFSEHVLLKSKDYPNKIAIMDSRISIDYKNLAKYVRRYAYQLLTQSIKPGDPVIILMDDCAEWVVSFLALIYVGANPVMLSHLLPSIKKQEAINIINPTLIIDNPKGVLLNQGTEAGPAHQFNQDEICIWATSSGTTGEPKFILHRHDNLFKLANIACPMLNINENSIIYTIPKLSFVYGLNCSITFALSLGATAIISEKTPSNKLIYSIVKKYKPTHLFTTPGVFASMIRQQKNSTNILNSVSNIFSAGESLPLVVKTRFFDIYGIYIREGYGSAEALSWVTVQTAEDSNNHNIGKPLPSITCEVRNAKGDICKTGEIGRLFINSPCSATMYYQDQVLTDQTFFNNYIATNDLVVTDNLGNLTFVSRSDDQIKINGSFAFPLEIENCIMQLDGVDDCVVTMQKNSYNLEEIVAFVVGTITASEIRIRLSAMIERHKIPKIIKFVDQLPRTINSKKIRKPLTSVPKL
jgi:acyl-coenzyme A synthetase/AMP-(fatty) acid ligase